MIGHPYSQLVGYKQWADRGLYDLVGQNLDRINAQDGDNPPADPSTISMSSTGSFSITCGERRMRFKAPRSEELPGFAALASSVREIDDWYASYVDTFAGKRFRPAGGFRLHQREPVPHAARRDRPARVPARRAIIGAMSGVVLHKNGIAPNHDRMTDFLETAE